MKYLFVCSRLDTMVQKRKRLLLKLIDDGHVVSLLSMEGSDSTEEILDDMGAEYKLISAKRNSITLLSDLKYMFGLYTYMLNFKPDVIVGYTIKPNIYTGILIGLTKVKVRFFPIVTGLGFAFQGGGIFREILKKIVIILYRVSFNNANKVIMQNDDNKRYFTELRIAEPHKISVIHGDGVELPNLNEKKFNKIKKFVCISRLLGEKGLRELHLACLEVKKKYSGFFIQLYGAKEYSSDAISDRELKIWRESGTILWEGYCHSIESLLQSVDALILPSYHEGMSTAVCEAISFGLPVIGTDISGIREMVDGNGFLVKVKNVSSLAVALEALLSLEGKRWKEMSEKSFEIACSGFDREIIMDNIYNEVCHNG